MFSNQNMQLSSTVAGQDEAYFSTIPFGKVYSEGGTGGDRSYTDARCAEVLPSSPLNLANCLRGIYFRTEAERDTLLYLLGRDRAKWAAYCHVSDALKVFQKDYTFVQEVRLTPKGVVFRFNHRRDRRNLNVSIKVWNSSNREIVNFSNNDHAAAPNLPYDNWLWEQKLENGLYLVEVHLEGVLAYRNQVELGDSLF
jgi:hypothetical protein